MEQQLLEQLVDVYQPDAVSWWPLAPGWWLLIILGALSLSLLSFWLIERYRKNYWRKEALAKLKDIHTKFSQEPSKAELIALMQLVKSILFTKSNDSRTLSLVGPELNQMATTLNTSISIDKELSLLNKDIYQSKNIEFKTDNFDNIRAWIKGL